MFISTKGRYATRMLLDIAMNQADGYVPLNDVAKRQQLSKKYLESFTSQFTAKGILAVRRGKSGGYRLLRKSEDITLLEILLLTEGSFHSVACLECSPNICKRAGFCMTLPAWQGLDDVVYSYLKSVTLKSLIDQAKPQPENASDFSCIL